MNILGSCHCQNLSFTLSWPNSAAIAARLDGCSFCKAHNAAWTSNREAELVATIRDSMLVSKYRFGTKSADFYICKQCGIVPWVISEVEGKLYAVVNVNTFTNADPATITRSPSNLEGEAVGDRLARRAKNWIPNVTIIDSTLFSLSPQGRASCFAAVAFIVFYLSFSPLTSAFAADATEAATPLPRDVSRQYVPSKYDWKIPAWMPKPLEPRNNPTTAAKVELGRHLFYDHRLSINSTRACGTCHQQAFAFTDGQRVSRGALGHRTKRNSMTLVNSAYLPVLMWSNPSVHTLEQQMLVPLLGDDPLEMGMVGRDAIMIARLQSEPIYTPLFRAAFPESKGEVTLDAIVKSLAAFQRTLISARSPYDRYKHEGDAKAISAAAIRGEQLFFGEKLKCHHCHGNFNFNDSSIHEGNRRGEVAYHNTGLYNVDGKGAYPADNMGLYEHSKRPRDMGRFRAPTLRNIGVTEPYMHDGSIATLPEVLDHYAAGGRTLAEGPNAGSGKNSPLKSPLISGFEITKEERADLLAFLRSLTDMDFLFDPRFADPWPHDPQ